MSKKSTKEKNPPLSQCDNCSKYWPDAQLDEVKDLTQRISPGGQMPSGQCPDCGCLCYPVKQMTAAHLANIIGQAQSQDDKKFTEVLLESPELIIQAGADGVWLHFKSKSNLYGSINLTVTYSDQKTIHCRAITEWCKEYSEKMFRLPEKRKVKNK